MTASPVFRRPQGAKQTRSGLNNRARGSAPVVAGLGGSPTSKMERRPEGRPWNGPMVATHRHCLPNCQPLFSRLKDSLYSVYICAVL